MNTVTLAHTFSRIREVLLYYDKSVGNYLISNTKKRDSLKGKGLSVLNLNSKNNTEISKVKTDIFPWVNLCC